ncbi:hypothetical protein GAY29_21115 [Azospirillum brasilense]|uniref:hypothetical protein n=1 Tax=Azospirillum brasilense TaxID=192 RepID=UPI00190953DC|nr:hypothetical protein [Azospirillum brasilense]MBK3735557.1 hypothetical protein [Azospirillum brasilense]
MKRPPQFATEADLCSAFMAQLPPGWTAYPETAGWDILLVHTSGVQVGIQAKLRLNAKVLTQASENYWDLENPGPDYRAILVPAEVGTDLEALAAYCSMTVVRCWPPQTCWMSSKGSHSPDLPGTVGSHESYWFPLLPAKRHPLPDYVPDVTAGASAPRTLSRWKVSALRVQALLDQTGYVTRQDFKALQIDIRRWIAGGWQAWLEAVPNSGTDDIGFPHFKRGATMPDFGAQHPEVYPQVKATMADWMPKWRNAAEVAR